MKPSRIISRRSIGAIMLLVVLPFVAAAQTLETDTDRPGQDYRRLVMPTCKQKCDALPASANHAKCLLGCKIEPTDPGPVACMQECYGDQQCRAFSYVKPGVQVPQGVCYLKREAVAKRPDTCCVSGRRKVINMVTVGDSVMWGMGLLPQDKFRNLLEAWIRDNNLGRNPVDQYAYAVAGAIIGVDHDQAISVTGAMSTGDPRETWDGEVPRSVPTLYRQIDLAVADLKAKDIDPGEVDLVLLSGGANDVSFVDMASDPSIGSDGVRCRIQDFFVGDTYCRNPSKPVDDHRMAKIYRYALQQFPNAAVLVTGYYAPFKLQSDPLSIFILGSAFGGVAAYDILGASPVAAQFATIAAPLVTGYSISVASQVTTFRDEIEKAIDYSVKSALEYVDPATNAKPYAGRKLVHVPVGIGDSCALFTTPSCLWGVSLNVSNTPTLYLTDDPQRENRRLACAATNPSDLTCPVGAAMHPNVEGARAYFTSLQDTVKRVKPSLAGIKQFELQVDGTEQAQAGKTMRTVTVNALDVETRASIPGDVAITVTRTTRLPSGKRQVSAQVIQGKTGTPITYEACSAYSKDDAAIVPTGCPGAVTIGGGYVGGSYFVY